MEWLKGFLLTAAVFIPLEWLFTRQPDQKTLRRGWLNDVIYWVVNAQIITVGLSFVVIVTVLATSWLMPTAIKTVVANQPYWLQFVETIVLSDLGFYFMHRAFHAIPMLWKFHSIHHSIEELDWLAGARVHPIDQIMTKGFSLLPVFAFGFSEVIIGAYMTLYAWQSVLIHSNVRIEFGPFRWVLASPEFHRWHHSNDQIARDKNFAGQLPVLDVLFGTLHMPRGKTPKSYGVDERIPTTYLSQLVYPFQRHRAGSVGIDAELSTPAERFSATQQESTTAREERTTA